MKRLFAVLTVLLLTAGILIVVPDGEGAPVPTRDTGRILYVAPENSTYMDIDQALWNATEGDIIYVAPGIYENGMLISISDITVIGNHTEGDVIVGNAGDAIAGIHAGGVKVSGITFTDDNPHFGIISMSGAGDSELTDVKFIATSIGEGLNIRGCENVTFRNITIRTIDWQAVRILRSSNIKFNNFSFSCNTSMGGCFELDSTDDIVLEEGLIELRGEGTAIYNLAGRNLTLTDVTADYNEKFIMMETGNVSIYNMDIDPADILMDVPDPIHTVRSFFLRSIMVSGEGPDGEMMPLEGAELNLTRDGVNIYSTVHYGGSDPTSNIDGYFPEKLPFLSWEMLGGGDGDRKGINRIGIRFEGDMPSEYVEEQTDANTTDDLVIELIGIYDQVRTLEGYITYLDGPMAGEYAENATIYIHIPSGEIKNFTVNETGKFVINDLPLGVNLSIDIRPIEWVTIRGDEDGYLVYHGWINISDREEINFTLSYFKSNIGSIYGFVRYQGGPKDGLFCEGADVKLFDEIEAISYNVTNASGYYEFTDLQFPAIFEIRITPPLDELGVNLEITGYLFWDGSAHYFNGSEMINASLKYYEHVEPASPHPEVTILDDNGDPLEGAQVEVTIEGATYIAKTNMFGKAVFQNLDMEDFPLDAEFKASKEGYDDVEWEQGDDIPAIKESGSEDQTWLLVILVIVVLLVLAVAAYLIFMRKGDVEEFEE